MPVEIKIYGDTAPEAMRELRDLSEGLHPQRTSGAATMTAKELAATHPEAQPMTDDEALRLASSGGKAAEPEPAPKTTKKKAAAKAKTKPEAEPKDDGEDETTIDDVKRVVRGFLGTFDDNAEGQKAAQVLLADNFDVKKVGQLAEADYAKAINVFQSAIDERG